MFLHLDETLWVNHRLSFLKSPFNDYCGCSEEAAQYLILFLTRRQEEN